MSKQLKLRRGTTAQHSTFTGASGEITVDTDKKTLVVHDGVTAGGKPLATTGANTFSADQVVNGVTVGRGAGGVATNTAVGANALSGGSQTGTSVVAIGYNAGKTLTTGVDSVAVGANALQFATTGSSNVGVGQAALYQTTSGSYNSAYGTGALQNNTTASYNTAIGYQASYSGTDTYNTSVGYQALYSNTNAYNTAIGQSAGKATTTGSITAVGSNVLLSNTTGAANVGIGGNANGISTAALQSNTTGGYNTGVGVGALYSNTTASNNTAVGYQAGYSGTTATNQTFVGYQAGYASTGSGNTCVGQSAGVSLTSGTNNTFVGAYSSTGYGAGYLVTTGSKNTILGGYNGNQGGLDIRTASNYIVLSDGDGNPREYFDGSGNRNTYCQGTTPAVKPAYDCRAWVNFNGTGTVAIRGSGNITSITDNGVGDYTLNFTNAMPDGNYSMTGASQANSTPTYSGWQTLYNMAAPATSSCRIGTGSSSVGTDCAWNNVAIFR